MSTISMHYVAWAYLGYWELYKLCVKVILYDRIMHWNLYIKRKQDITYVYPWTLNLLILKWKSKITLKPEQLCERYIYITHSLLTFSTIPLFFHIRPNAMGYIKGEINSMKHASTQHATNPQPTHPNINNTSNLSKATTHGWPERTDNKTTV